MFLIRIRDFQTVTRKIQFQNMEGGRKLVLHIDVNNTILVGDSKTKLTALEGVLNEFVTEIVWGTIDEHGNWIPTQNPISTKPPSKEAVSYYSYAECKFEEAGKPRSEFKKHARRFTLENQGQQFRPYVERVQERLKFKGELSDSETQLLDPLFRKEKDGLYYRIIPSFFKLLNHLLISDRNFSVVLRTFGCDGDLALKATKLFSQNLHPEFKFPASKILAVDLSPGKISPSKKGIHVTTGDNVEYCGEGNIYEMFGKLSGVQLYLDDYSWWKRQGFGSSGGKPLWVDPQDSSVHHILFDDNIRTWNPDNNIVNLLVKEKGKFTSRDSQEFNEMCVMRTDLFESILNENYFIEKVQMCEENYDKSRN